MTAVLISELRAHVGETVTVRGWVVTTRSSGKIAFMVLRDGSAYVQGVLSKKEVPAATWEAFAGLTQEASVALVGTVREEPRSPGGYELAVTGLEVLGASVDYPITPKEHGTTYLFEHRHLWLRTRRQAAIARVRHEVEQAIRESLLYARSHQDEVLAYVKEHSQEMDRSVMMSHIDLYVNDFSLDLGDEGVRAVQRLFAEAEQKGIFPSSNSPLFARA